MKKIKNLVLQTIIATHLTVLGFPFMLIIYALSVVFLLEVDSPLFYHRIGQIAEEWNKLSYMLRDLIQRRENYLKTNIKITLNGLYGKKLIKCKSCIICVKKTIEDDGYYYTVEYQNIEGNEVSVVFIDTKSAVDEIYRLFVSDFEYYDK